MESSGGGFISQFVLVEAAPVEHSDNDSGAPSFSVRRVDGEPLQRDSERGRVSVRADDHANPCSCAGKCEAAGLGWDKHQ
jgi:hypothetical protein